jgi:hypothetical protein
VRFLMFHPMASVATLAMTGPSACRRRSGAAGFAGHSVAATRKLLQERGETFRDRLVGGIVLGPEPLPEFPQPWPSGQDVTTFGLARPTLPALAPTTKFSAARGVPLDA